MVLVEGSTQNQFEKQFEKLRAALDNNTDTSFAIGSCFEEDCHNIRTAMKTGDALMYKDKSFTTKSIPKRNIDKNYFSKEGFSSAGFFSLINRPAIVIKEPRAPSQVIGSLSVKKANTIVTTGIR